MANPSGNPFNYSSSMAQSNGVMPHSTARLALDNLLRRELKVGDPNDPQQVAQALLSRYKDTPKAVAITREAQGVPFLLAPATPVAALQTATSSDAELQQAMDDVERDLHELTNNAILKDITVELQGWATAIRAAIQEGVTAARMALDTRQRDKTFGIRRTLGDYARMARLVGTLTPSMTVNYRKLAQSLDEVSSVLLVMMGESLASIGFNGRMILQVPYSDLQQRRDAVIAALRNFVGSTQVAYGQDDWPRGLNDYTDLLDSLDRQGQGDLRALLSENELTRIMDLLIQRADQGNVSGLRALGATAQIDIERLRRMVVVGSNASSAVSPPFSAFLVALKLFINSFNSAGGFRLLRIARPAILTYGLYGMSNLSNADERLLKILIDRNLLANKLDCLAQCGCDRETIPYQIILDKILYDVDRAIDLYAVGTKDDGEPENRAVAYAYLINKFLASQIGILEMTSSNFLTTRFPELGISKTLAQIEQQLSLSSFSHSGDDRKKMAHQELCIQREQEKRWQSLVQTFAPDCVSYNDIAAITQNVIESAINAIGSSANACNATIPSPQDSDTSLELLVKRQPTTRLLGGSTPNITTGSGGGSTP
ncbi:MAG: hypothetical protein SFW36_07665, partial [Leptolyngbyaceae cyanobacterium bins.59]|nr:hypothetical protein [Leptolyngbyaceae cyanobacterium bins.59]